MPAKIDKVILTNLGALKVKYGSEGVRKIKAAVKRLIHADSRRGLRSRLIALDDEAAMQKLDARPVRITHDPRQNKNAVDDIYRKLSPDYILLLGSSDVIPHQDLRNPMHHVANADDRDVFAYGDLPYACEGRYSQSPERFVGPTRVVGRLPDVTGGDDPSYLVRLLSTAARYRSMDQEVFQKYFGVTAEVFERSSTVSMMNVFCEAQDLKRVPPRGSDWNAALLQRRAHFFNCHGGDHSAQFKGQPAGGRQVYPVALDGAFIDGRIAEGTVVAAECCYGAQLYSMQGDRPMGICNVYLKNRAYGFFGSTTIAYGEVTDITQADLLCQYFMQNVRLGASLGRATLEARQQFVRTSSPMDPSDVKTLAQFNLYGDPSIVPVRITPFGIRRALSRDVRIERQDRRLLLVKEGLHLAAREPVPTKTGRERVSRKLRDALRRRARDHGIDPGTMLSFTRSTPPQRDIPDELRTTASGRSTYHVVFDKPRPPRDGVIRIVAIIIAKEADGRLVTLAKVHSR